MSAILAFSSVIERTTKDPANISSVKKVHIFCNFLMTFFQAIDSALIFFFWQLQLHSSFLMTDCCYSAARIKKEKAQTAIKINIAH